MSNAEAFKVQDLSPKTRANHVRKKFLDLHNREPILVRSPGRINLIGEHTDYNEGFVMPAAIDRDIVFAVAFSDESHSTLYSIRHNELIPFDIHQPNRVSEPLWPNYLLGVARSFLDKGYELKNMHAVVGGDVPTGAGLSSSAALECGFAYAMDQLHSFNVSKLDLILMAQWAEHHYAGVKCGIMDQFSSMMGVEGKAFVLDCRTLSYHYIPVDLKDYSIVLCDTMVKHSLANSAYNKRREECEQGVSILRKYFPQIRTLRDVSPQMIEQHRSEFPKNVLDRCSYVVAENQRVLDASEDLKNGDMRAFGKKMYATHDGLSKLYEVSCRELDFLVNEARALDYVAGARMMGGGFGGCTINLLAKTKVEPFIKTLRESYAKNFNHEMNAYVVAIKNGTSLLNLSDLAVNTIL